MLKDVPSKACRICRTCKELRTPLLAVHVDERGGGYDERLRRFVSLSLGTHVLRNGDEHVLAYM